MRPELVEGHITLRARAAGDAGQLEGGPPVPGKLVGRRRPRLEPRIAGDHHHRRRGRHDQEVMPGPTAGHDHWRRGPGQIAVRHPLRRPAGRLRPGHLREELRIEQRLAGHVPVIEPQLAQRAQRGGTRPKPVRAGRVTLRIGRPVDAVDPDRGEQPPGRVRRHRLAQDLRRRSGDQMWTAVVVHEPRSGGWSCGALAMWATCPLGRAATASISHGPSVCAPRVMVSRCRQVCARAGVSRSAGSTSATGESSGGSRSSAAITASADANTLLVIEKT